MLNQLIYVLKPKKTRCHVQLARCVCMCVSAPLSVTLSVRLSVCRHILIPITSKSLHEFQIQFGAFYIIY